MTMEAQILRQIESKAQALGREARKFMESRPQFIEVLRSGEELIESAPSYQAILPNLLSTEWFRTVAGEAPAGLREGLLEIVELLCLLPNASVRRSARLNVISIFYTAQASRL